MENIIRDFAHTLKDCGLEIATGEITDALKALDHFGLEDEKRFYTILQAAMVKDENDRETFDLAYSLYFHKIPITAPKSEESCGSRDIPLKGTAGMSPKAKTFYGAILNQDQQAIAAAIDDAVTNIELNTLNIDELLRQAKVSLSWFMVDNALELNNCLTEREQLKKYEKQLALTLAQKTAAKSPEAKEELLQGENLWEQDFNSLSANRIKAMEKRIEKLGRKLGAKYSYRLIPSKRGIINMRRVMGETAKRGYPSEKMHYLAKVRNRPSLIILCDISGSMARYSTFFLQLVYAMEKRFKDIDSFLFIDNIVAAKFPRNSNSPSSAIAAAILEAYVPRTGRTGQHCTTTGVSDYGKAFHYFLEKFADSLSPEKTMLILGDAKNNWFPSQKGNLKTISQGVKEIIWLNPQPRSAWNQEDSVIGEYADFCSQVLECRNLRQLTEFAESL